MPVPALSDLITPSSTSNGLFPESIEERILTVASMLASGTAPDGTALPNAGTAGGSRPSFLSWRVPSQSLSPSINLLTANQASLESGTTNGWDVLTNCTISSSTLQALDGTHSLALTSVAAGDMSATTHQGVNGIPVTGGVTYTAMFWARAATTPRSVTCYLQWYDVSGAPAGNIPVVLTDTTTGWTQYVVSAVAPMNVRFADVACYVTATGAASEVHYFDQIGFFAGTTTWTPGGRVGATIPAATIRERTLAALSAWTLRINPDGTTF
jgi:hypothetical protein